MGREQLIKRTISSLSGLPLRDLHMNTIAGSDQSDDKIAKYTNAVARAVELPIWIDDAGGINIVELRTKARRLKAKYDIGLIIVDYLQLISPTGMSQGKILAKDLAIPVIALSQLSRAVEARDDKRPMLSDLRESGSIEQDADIVMFIHREELYHPGTEKHKGRAKLIVAKHRNGATGEIDLAWIAERATFDDIDLTKVVDM
jgi:replicative DNA helicase